MRQRRLKAPDSLPAAYYHCVSRIVNRDFVLGEAEKGQFYQFMRLYERLYGLRVISYCLMSNHFHILVEVPQRPDEADLPNDEGLLSLVRSCLGEGAETQLRWELELYRGQENNAAAEALREKWFARMWDVSAFMKVLKQRFTQWFNRRHNRRGTLWEDRFKSVLVEGKGPALKAMSAYIELNPVRAQICEDPKDYRWCSYGEAVAGGKRAQEAIAWTVSFTIGMTGEARDRIERDPEARTTLDSSQAPNSETLKAEGLEVTEEVAKRANVSPKGSADLDEALRRFRCYLFGIPENELRQEKELAREKLGGRAQIFRERLSREKALEVLAEGGRLKQSDFLRCRVRYFADGMALGSKEFIEGVFESSAQLFHKNRKTGSRSLKGLEAAPKTERLYNMRQLQKNVIS